jgi:mono/diheme cytochrome c family protein
MPRQRLVGISAMLMIIVGLLAVALTLPVAAQGGGDVTPTGGEPLDLLMLPQSGVLAFYDTPAQSSQTGKPVDLGDFDGDGCGDLIATGHNATHSVNGTFRRGDGHVRIIFDLCPPDGGPIEGRIALEDDPPTYTQRVLTIYGERPGDMAGTEVYAADFDADGYDDLLLGAQNYDGPQQFRLNGGAAYVVFGYPDLPDAEDIDLAAPPDDVLKIIGDNDEDRLGLWVEGGDFDDDGFQDLLLGANQADGIDNARINAGEAWIIYGAEDMLAEYGPVIDLRTPPSSATRLIGADYDDLFGSTVVGGDLDGDGIDDALVSAALWRGSAGVGGLSFGGGDGPGNTRFNAGETFVIYGGPDLRGQTLDMAALLVETGAPRDDQITVIYGVDANDLLGEEIALGDVDGDGQNDLVLGSLVTDGPDNSLQEAGEAWVIYTNRFIRGQMFDMAQPPRDAVVIYPDQPFSKGGDTVRVADVDGDGYGDVLYGAPDYDPTGYDGILRRNAGMLAVIYGQADPLPSAMTLPSEAPEGLRVQYVIGADQNDMLAYSMAVYDANGDGTPDLVPNGMGGDGAYNTQINAGDLYIIDGATFVVPHEFATSAGAPDSTPRPATSTPAPTETPVFEVDTSVPGDVDRGRTLYRQTCAGCHGVAADGEGVGVPLVGTTWIETISDEDLLAFLRVGRSSDAPENVTGVTMPAFGGRADWGDAELWDNVAYLRYLNEPK